MENTKLQKFLDGFAERVMNIVLEQMQVQGADFPIEAIYYQYIKRTAYHAYKGDKRVLLCIVHDIVSLQEGDDLINDEVTFRQDVQVPSSDGRSFITLS